MSLFRPARPSDLPIGLGAERAAYDLWGRLQWERGQAALGFDERRAALAQGLWIWTGPGEPRSIPMDQDPLAAASAPKRLEALHDRLRILQEERLPDNFADVIWRAAGCLQEAASSAPRSCLAWLAMSSRPSSALLNALHAAFLCELLSARLGLDERGRRDIACAALTMNWTISRLQDELNASGKTPTALQRQLIMSHPADAERLLIDYGVQSPLWLSCCRQHHEDPEGHGYPDKLRGEALAPEGALLRCADRYATLSAQRPRRDGLPPAQAIELLREQERSFDPGVVEALASLLGPLPPGSPVWTEQGEPAWLLEDREGGLADIACDDGRSWQAPVASLSLREGELLAPSQEALAALASRR